MDSLNINSTFDSASTGFNVYYSSNYFFGFNSIIVGYDETSNYNMDFDITNTFISSGIYRSVFAYTGSADGKFFASYSYLILL